MREPLPAYLAYVEGAFPGSQRVLSDQRQLFYENLQKKVKGLAFGKGESPLKVASSMG
jgi:hypothetical protein